MLFDTTLRRELARTFGATLVIILTIVLTMMLMKTIGQAAAGTVAPQDIVAELAAGVQINALRKALGATA